MKTTPHSDPAANHHRAGSTEPRRATAGPEVLFQVHDLNGRAEPAGPPMPHVPPMMAARSMSAVPVNTPAVPVSMPAAPVSMPAAPVTMSSAQASAPLATSSPSVPVAEPTLRPALVPTPAPYQTPVAAPRSQAIAPQVVAPTPKIDNVAPAAAVMESAGEAPTSAVAVAELSEAGAASSGGAPAGQAPRTLEFLSALLLSTRRRQLMTVALSIAAVIWLFRAPSTQPDSPVLADGGLVRRSTTPPAATSEVSESEWAAGVVPGAPSSGGNVGTAPAGSPVASPTVPQQAGLATQGGPLAPPQSSAAAGLAPLANSGLTPAAAAATNTSSGAAWAPGSVGNTVPSAAPTAPAVTGTAPAPRAAQPPLAQQDNAPGNATSDAVDVSGMNYQHTDPATFLYPADAYDVIISMLPGQVAGQTGPTVE